MGWKLKTLGVFTALAFLAGGLWPIFLLILAVIIIPPIAKTRGWGAAPSSADPGGTGRRFPYRELLGAFFLLLALITVVAGGTISVLIFGVPAVVLLAWGRVQPPALVRSLKPIRNSILLRTRLFPFHWTALVQVKPITADLGRALSGLQQEILLTTSGIPAIHITVSTFALGEGSAEGAILRKIERVGRGVVPLGVYLLPLDSEQAFSVLSAPIESEKVPEEAWAVTISTSPYDVMSIMPGKGFPRSLGLYRKKDTIGTQLQVKAPAVVPIAHTRFKHTPLLWEVFKSMDGRVDWPNPDRYTTFLSSIFATSYESLGSNIIDAGTNSKSETVVVKSHSSPPVELSRAQLRAIMAVYAQGAPIQASDGREREREREKEKEKEKEKEQQQVPQVMNAQ